jgi:hypothetical protein
MDLRYISKKEMYRFNVMLLVADQLNKELGSPKVLTKVRVTLRNS